MCYNELSQKEGKTQMIYCGYQGVGKTSYCKQHPTTTIDLDSSAFEKYPKWEENYIKIALSLSQDKDVFISAHKEVIEYCINNRIIFAIVAPKASKEMWRARLQFRLYKNNTVPNAKALTDFELNFEKDMEYFSQLQAQGVSVRWVSASVVTTLNEIIPRK